ncbi:mucin-5AC isoform X1 [Hermetia illucens]|nr:mucin-5AC isoform X1 [Hermetia illucens]
MLENKDPHFKMNLKWGTILLYIGIALVLQSTRCDAGSRVVPTDPQTLAKQTGAAHFEEHFEPVESEESGEHKLRKRASDEDFDYEVYQGVVGRAGIDFPIHAHIPQTSFSCRQYGNGYFADLETDCQVFHICDDGRKISFLCPNGTIFQQPELICDWWFKVNCGKSPNFYADSAEIQSRGQSRRKSHKRVENDYSSNGKKNSYRASSKSNGFKSQYPLKSSKRYEESDRLNQAKHSDRRIDSEESVSAESIDFEDITEGTRTYYRKSDKFQAGGSNDNENESQVVAETASFVSNNGRNGYNYDNPIPGRKSSVERDYSRNVASQRPKNDRGRQKYDFRSNVYKNQNQPRSQEDFLEVSTFEPATFTIGSKPNLLGSRSQSRFSTPRPNSYTTARRFDITKTTPFYTPTVPTVSSRFGEYKSTPVNAGKPIFNNIVSTPVPFAQRKGTILPQLNERFNQGASNDYHYSKPSSFRVASTTAAPVRTTYFVSDGRRPAVDIRLHNGTVTSTPSYFTTTGGSTHTTPGYNYSPFSTVTPNSIGFGPSKLSSPAPFSIFSSGERTTSPPDVVIANRFESLKQDLSRPTTSTSFPQVKTESVEILANDQPTSHDVNIKVTTALATDSPVETITGNAFVSSNKDESGKLIGSTGYAYDNPSTQSNLIGGTSTFGYSTVSNEYTTTISPTQNPQSVPPRPEAEGAGLEAFDQKRNILSNGGNLNIVQTTTFKPQEIGFTGYPARAGVATSTFAPPISTYSPQQPVTSTSFPDLSGAPISTIVPQSPESPTSTFPPQISELPTSTLAPQFPAVSTESPTHSSTTVPEDLPPTTYRPSLTPAPTLTVVDHVKDMIKTLNDLKVPVKVGSRQGLDIPSSSGPSSLHSLAEYFASAEVTSTTEVSTATDDNRSGDHDDDAVAVKSDLDGSNLTGKTVNKYKDLFGLSTTTTPPEPTISPYFQPNIAPDANDLEGQHSSGLLGDNVGKPETRKIAQVFTNALSAYLQDPESFRKVLTEVRPTEPPGAFDGEFAHGTAASYLPTIPTTITPTIQPFAQTATPRSSEGLEVLDYSDVTITPGSGAALSAIRSTTVPNEVSTTTQEPTYANPATVTAIPNYMNKVPASKLITESLRKTEVQVETNAKLQAKTEGNSVAEEINSGLGLSTIEPYLSLAESVAARKPSVEVSNANEAQSTTSSNDNSGELSTTAAPPSVSFELLPPSADGDINIDDDEDTLQRAQSQSFVTARNKLNRLEAQGKRFESLKLSTTISPRFDFGQTGHYITRIMTDSPSTTEIPDYKRGTITPWPTTTSYTTYVDPLTINDELMSQNETVTTTASPHTYLPRSTPPQPTPVNVDIEDAGETGTSTIRSFLHPDIPEEDLPPANGIQRIANKMFGNLDVESASHLMSVMKKAESNATVRKLILLLIQTCDDNYNKTVEQSRKILLNALIGMDQKLEGDEEVKVFQLQPDRQAKSIEYSSQSEKLIASTVGPSVFTSPQFSVSTVPNFESSSTISSSGEETTKFQTRSGESNEEVFGGGSTLRSYESEYSTIASTQEPSAYSTPEPLSIAQTTVQPQNNRRRTKDVNDSIGQAGFESDLSHKNSDERALELLKSLYSLASKFSKR